MNGIYKSVCPSCGGKTVIKITPNQKKENILVKCNSCHKIHKVVFRQQ